jgi:hypothetical protein
MKLVWASESKIPLLAFASFALGLLQMLVFQVTSTTAQGAKQVVPENVAPHPAPVQPIPYSHKTHLALGLTCQNCHTNPDPGNMMTFPATAKCMQCHVDVSKDSASIQKLAEFAKSGQPIPWVRVYEVTAGVNWNHRRHLQAGVECAVCHGQVPQLDSMSQTTAVTSMATCISCHQANRAPTVCKTCHSWPSN